MNQPLPDGTVTFLFTDIEKSTDLWEKYQDGMKSALVIHDSILKDAVETSNGYLVKNTGDGILAVFDKTIDAAKATLKSQCEIQSAFVKLPSPLPLKVRMGIHTGEADLRNGDYHGSTVNLASRVMGLGYGGQILLSESTASLIKNHLPQDCTLLDLGDHRLKGIAKPEHIYQLCHPELVPDFPPLKSLTSFKHNLHSQPSTFIGRQKELADVKRLLKETKLLTLLGPGGTGKTRLMLQVAEEIIENYPDGVWLVELAPLSDPEMVPERVASIFNIQAQAGRTIQDILIDYLRRKELLLLLDNVEHLVSACANLVEHLLAHCPKLTILVTGRESLFIDGEMTIQVPSLSMPEYRQTIEEIAGSEGVQLFIERARSVHPDFSLDEQNASTVGEIVRRLDGIPLALELAATRLRMLTLEQINDKLNDRFRLLTGGRRTALPRQQTLQALIDWSWQLLDETERVLLRRLSVFSGGWTLDAAQTIAGFDPLDEYIVFENLEQLINKSLVLVDSSNIEEARYGMLESIRQFARDKMFEAGEADTLRDRHAEYYVALTVRADEELYLKDALNWIDRLRRELDNQRAVIAWTQNERPDLALRLLGHLRHNRGHWLNPREADTWFSAVIPGVRDKVISGSTEVNLEDYIRALLAFAVNETVQGRNTIMREIADEAVALARLHKFDRLLAASIALKGLAHSFEMSVEILQEMEQAVQVSRKNGYLNELALNLLTLCGLYFMAGETDRGERYLEEVKQIRMELGSPLGLAIVSEGISGLTFFQQDWETALSSTQESIEFFEKLDASQNLAMGQSRLGHILRQSGDITGAKQIYRQTIISWQELGNVPAVAHQLECFAYLSIGVEDYQRAAQLIGAASVIRERLNAPIENPMEMADMRHAMAQLNRAVSEDEQDRWITEGKRMSLDEAVSLALSE